MAHFFKPDKSMFGVDPCLTTEGLRGVVEAHPRMSEPKRLVEGPIFFWTGLTLTGSKIV